MRAAARCSRVALFLASRSLLRGNRGILATTVAMMAIVYLNLLFLPALIDGASDRVFDRLVETQTGDLTVTPAGGQAEIAGVDPYLRRIEEQRGVAAATALRLVGNRIYHGSDNGSWSVYATDPGSFDRVFTSGQSLIEGHWVAEGEDDGIVLGIGIAGAGESGVAEYRNSLKTVRTGDRVKVILADGRPHRFRVVGIFDDQFRPADAKAYVADSAAERLLPGSAGGADSVYVKAAPGVGPDALRRRILPLREPVRIETATELEGPIAEQTRGFDLIADILTVVSALVAAIAIFIVTYIDLVNRRRQVGIERAIGIRAGAIVGASCLKALAYAVMGIALGALLFRLAVVPFVAGHPFRFPNGPVSLAPERRELIRDGLLLAVVAMISALVPAWRSVRIGILDAIWGP